MIGMQSQAPIERGLTGTNRAKFAVSESEKVIFQMIVLEMSEGRVQWAKKLRYIQTVGWLQSLEATKL